MRERNWSQYNRQLVQRGSITFLLDPKIFKIQKTKKMGRPYLFSNSLIMVLMMVKIHHRLSYRTLEGFTKSLFAKCYPNCSLPSFSAICKRARSLSLPKLSIKRPSCIAIDASGFKVYGEGEWKTKVHGKSKRRKWIKVHIAIDPNSQEIIALSTTSSSVHDSQALPSLLKQIPKNATTVLADGAYDGHASRKAILSRGAKALIPPPKNARIHKRDPDRDDAIRIIRGLGGDLGARSLWGKLTSYSRRSLVETAFSRIKRLFGPSVFSKRHDSQCIENKLRCLLLNKMIRLTP